MAFKSMNDSAKSASKELLSALHSGLHATLGKLNLVTREEFVAQTEVLRNTRLKLEALEQRLNALEILLNKTST